MPPGKKTKNTLAFVGLFTVANVLGTWEMYHRPLLIYRLLLCVSIIQPTIACCTYSLYIIVLFQHIVFPSMIIRNGIITLYRTSSQEDEGERARGERAKRGRAGERERGAERNMERWTR